MKIFILLIIAVLLLLSLAVYLLWWLDSLSAQISGLARTALDGTENNSLPQAKNSVAQIKQLWEKNHTTVHCVINHTTVDNISATIIKAEAYLEQNKPEESAVELKLLIFAIDNLSHLEAITLENIF